MKVTVCDRCKKEITSRLSSDISISLDGRRIDLCPNCEKEFETWFGKSNKAVIKADNSIPKIKNVGYSQHDCETWYECPYCKEQMGSWQLFHEGVKEGEAFECPKCKKKIRY